MAIRLCDGDRERFGCDEWLEFSPLAISVADMEELSDRFGFDPEDWPEPFIGQLTLEQAGNPDAKPKPPRWRNHAVAWMLLRQNGHDVSWEEAGAVRLHLAKGGDPPPVEGPGKETQPELATSEPSTTLPSNISTD